MPRALGARVLRRGAGPGPSPLILSRDFRRVRGPSGSPPGGGGGCGGRGMLSGSGAVRPGVRAPWAPPAWVGSGVVGGLVVNCIVDASICGRPRYRELCCWSPVCLFFCLVRRAARAGVVRVARAPQWRGDRRGRARLARRGRVAVSRAALCRVLCVVRFYERSVDALASGADEGRGGLRYSSGSRLAGCDPRVSEWGDPAPVVGRHPRLNVIGRGG